MEQISLRHAMVFSLLIHMLLFPGIGWLAGGWLHDRQPEQIIELDLFGDTEVGGGGAGSTGGGQDNASNQAAAAVQSEELAETIPAERVVAEAPAPVSESYFGTEAATPVQSASLSGTKGGSAGGGGSGGGTGGGIGGGTGPGIGIGSGSGAGGAGRGKVLPPRVLERLEPEYPYEARQKNIEGVVGVRIEILENGRPGEIGIVRSSGHGSLDDAARAAVRRWRFVPARDSITGAAVRSFTSLSIVFRLR